MADEMDPCECIWSHEMAMRRLLSWIRQTQAHCTDTECIDELPGASGQMNTNFFLMMSLFLIFAMAMYFMRPTSMRGNDADMKPHGGAGSRGTPPTPPPATS